MSPLEVYWQDVLVVAVVAIAVGSLVLRAYRIATQQQHGASCGGCHGSPENCAVSGGIAEPVRKCRRGLPDS